MTVLNYIKEKFKPKYKEKDEPLKENIREYLKPIISYFRYKKELNNEKISDNLKKGIKNLLDLTEKDCYKSLEEIEKILKDN